jgi:hypothetical protein
MQTKIRNVIRSTLATILLGTSVVTPFSPVRAQDVDPTVWAYRIMSNVGNTPKDRAFFGAMAVVQEGIVDEPGKQRKKLVAEQERVLREQNEELLRKQKEQLQKHEQKMRNIREGENNTTASKEDGGETRTSQSLVYTFNYWLDANKNGKIEYHQEEVGIKTKFKKGEAVTIIFTNLKYRPSDMQIEIYGPNGKKLYEHKAFSLADETSIRLSSAEGETTKKLMETIFERGGTGNYIALLDNGDERVMHRFEVTGEAPARATSPSREQQKVEDKVDTIISKVSNGKVVYTKTFTNMSSSDKKFTEYSNYFSNLKREVSEIVPRTYERIISGKMEEVYSDSVKLEKLAEEGLVGLEKVKTDGDINETYRKSLLKDYVDYFNFTKRYSNVAKRLKDDPGLYIRQYAAESAQAVVANLTIIRTATADSEKVKEAKRRASFFLERLKSSLKASDAYSSRLSQQDKDLAEKFRKSIPIYETSVEQLCKL